MPDELDILLDDYNANTLREMAEANGLSTLGNDGKKMGKEQLLTNMHADFFTRKRILTSYQQLSKTERAVLDRLLLRGGCTARTLGGCGIRPPNSLIPSQT